MGGKERLEYLVALRRIDALAVVDHMQFNSTFAGSGPCLQPHRTLVRTGMAQGIAEEIPQYPVKVTTIEAQFDVSFADLQTPERCGVVQGQFLEESRQERLPTQHLRLGTVAAAERRLRSKNRPQFAFTIVECRFPTSQAIPRRGATLFLSSPNRLE